MPSRSPGTSSVCQPWVGGLPARHRAARNTDHGPEITESLETNKNSAPMLNRFAERENIDSLIIFCWPMCLLEFNAHYIKLHWSTMSAFMQGLRTRKFEHMTVQKVIAFPARDRDYESWISWVECELAILGFDIAEQEFDWRALFDKGLKPEEAAAEAAETFESQ